jgi:hypothetical protein
LAYIPKVIVIIAMAMMAMMAICGNPEWGAEAYRAVSVTQL